MTTRLLYTVIPSQSYHKDETLRVLLDDMAEDLENLYQNGVEASLGQLECVCVCVLDCTIRWPTLQVMFGKRPLRFRVAVVAVKGDWPFLRKSMGLGTGYANTYKCHMCMGLDPCMLKVSSYPESSYMHIY